MAEGHRDEGRDEGIEYISEDYIHNFTNIATMSRILERVTSQLQSNQSRQQYVAFRGFHESDIPSFDRIKSRRQYRLLYSNFIGIVKIMPSNIHHMGLAGFDILIYHKMLQMGLSIERSLLFTGAARVKAHRSLASKEPDASFKPRTRGPEGIPSMVLEVGLLESLPRLRVDAAWWLMNTNEKTRIVIILEINVTNMSIHIETWVLGPGPQVSRQPIKEAEVDIDATLPQVHKNVELSIPWGLVFDDVFPGGPDIIEQDIIFSPAELERFAKDVLA